MRVYRLILDAVIDIFFKKEKRLLKQENPTLLCYKYLSKKQSTKLMLTLLLISGNAERNPGPTNIKYPSGEVWAINFLRSV